MNNVVKKRIVLAFVYGGPLILGLLLGANLVFPKQVFVWEKNKPEESSLVRIGENDFFAIPWADFGTIDFYLETPNKIDSESNKEETVVAQKGFPAAFYPISQQPAPNLVIKKEGENFYLILEKEKQLIPTENILNSYTKNKEAILTMSPAESQQLVLALKPAGFADGSIVSNGRQLFLISDGKKMPFASPVAFEFLGYDQKKIIMAKEEELKLHSTNQVVLDLISFHPNGSLIREEETKNYFLVKEQQLWPITDWQKQIGYENASPVSIPFNKEEKVCHPILGKCQFRPDQNFKNNKGNGYYFNLSVNSEVVLIRVEFSRSFSLLNLKRFFRL